MIHLPPSRNAMPVLALICYPLEPAQKKGKFSGVDTLSGILPPLLAAQALGEASRSRFRAIGDGEAQFTAAA
jgi:hypothetical protein